MRRKILVGISLVGVTLSVAISVSIIIQDNPFGGVNVIKTKILEQGDNRIHGFTYYDGYLWASTRTSPCRILKIDPDTLNYEKIILSSGLNDGDDIISANGYVWTILYTSPSKIVKIDPGTLNWEVVITFKSNELKYGGSLEYAFGYLWAGGHGKLAKINLNDLSYDVYDFSSVIGDAQFHALSSGGGYMWGSCPSAKRILRINPDNPTDYDSLYLSVPMTDDMTYINGYLYIGSEVTPSYVYKISDDLTYYSVKASDTICYGIFYHNDTIWGAYVGTPGKLAEFDLNLNLKRLHELPSNFNNANEIAFDKTGNLYVTCWEKPAKIVKLSVQQINQSSLLYLNTTHREKEVSAFKAIYAIIGLLVTTYLLRREK